MFTARLLWSENKPCMEAAWCRLADPVTYSKPKYNADLCVRVVQS